MIYGIGTDLTNTARFELGLERFGETYAERLLSPLELAEFRASTMPGLHRPAPPLGSEPAMVRAVDIPIAHYTKKIRSIQQNRPLFFVTGITESGI